jgi:hypothetical protein
MDGQAVMALGLQGTSVPAAQTKLDFETTANLSREALAVAPGDAGHLRALVFAQLGLRDVEAAQETADRLAGTGWTATSLDAVIPARLARPGGEAAARDDVAAAVRAGTCPPWALEVARARIAIHLGDFAAARAILVRGIEREPDAPALRALMTEVLIADGSAAQARAVVAHLGRPATAPGPEAARSAHAPHQSHRRQVEQG